MRVMGDQLPDPHQAGLHSPPPRPSHHWQPHPVLTRWLHDPLSGPLSVPRVVWNFILPTSMHRVHQPGRYFWSDSLGISYVFLGHPNRLLLNWLGLGWSHRRPQVKPVQPDRLMVS